MKIIRSDIQFTVGRRKIYQLLNTQCVLTNYNGKGDTQGIRYIGVRNPNFYLPIYQDVFCCYFKRTKDYYKVLDSYNTRYAVLFHSTLFTLYKENILKHENYKTRH